MSNRGENEGMRVLEEFGCEAIATIKGLAPDPTGRSINPGMGGGRSAELRSRTIDELLVLVREGGPGLSREELLLIHEIAAERMSRGEVPVAEGSVELSREAMRIAVDRIA